jgi:spermidine/putrescine transport system permease protein
MKRSSDSSQYLRRDERPARKRPIIVAAAVPATAWLIIFVLVPGIIIGVASLWTSDLYGLHPIWTLHQWHRVLTTPLYFMLLLKTMRIAVVATAISLIVAYPVALYLSQLRESTKRAALTIIFIPFWVGFVVRTFAWLPILGRQGLLNHVLLSLGITHAPISSFLYNEGAVYLGLINGYLLFMILPIYLALDSIDPAMLEAAADLSAGPWGRFRFVLLPLSMPGVLAGCIMVLLLNFGAYVTPALLGGPSGIMFSNAIAQQFIADNNWAFGACLSLLMTAAALCGLFAVSRTAGMRRLLAPGETR